MGKISFILGAGVGYVLGTKAGRSQFEQIKQVSSNVWQNPRVQEGVHKAEGRISDVARKQGSAVTDRVAGAVKERISGSGSSKGDEVSDGMTGSAGGPDAPMEATPPKPDIEQR